MIPKQIKSSLEQITMYIETLKEFVEKDEYNKQTALLLVEEVLTHVADMEETFDKLFLPKHKSTKTEIEQLTLG